MSNKFRHPFKWRDELHRVTSAFGRRANGSWHNGTDFAGRLGNFIFAIATGTVIAKGYGASLTNGYGHWVKIAHGNGVTSLYAHMRSATWLRVGQRVLWWAPIGRVGATGGATGPHLHLEVAINDVEVDPLNYIRKH